MSKKQIKGLISDYIINEYGIDANGRYEVVTVPARSLITPMRLDLMAKLLYIEYREKKIDSDFGKLIYKKHIEAFSNGTFTEPGSPSKNSIDVYIKSFDKLIDDIKEKGFDSSKSAVPVGANGIPIDGSHRIAVCAYFDLPINIVELPSIKKENVYDYNFFSQRNLDGFYIENLALEYVKVKKHSYAVCIWPKAYSLDGGEKADDIVKNSTANILLHKNVTLGRPAMKNFLLQIYGHHYWVGSYKDKFKGTEKKVVDVYGGRGDMRVYFLAADSLDVIKKLKNDVRKAYGIGNHSIHITDDQAETIQLAKLMLNENSLHHIKNSDLTRYHKVHERLVRFKKYIRNSDLDMDNFVVDSGSVLSIYGIRDSTDLDLITNYDHVATDDKEIEKHDDEQLSYHDTTAQDLIYNPRNHFYFNDVKFISLPQLKVFKKNRNEPKDIEDIKLIKTISDPGFYSAVKKFRLNSKRAIRQKYVLSRMHAIYTVEKMGLKPLAIKLRNTIVRNR